MKKKSLTINAMLSSIRTLANVLFPLITYPYIMKVLSVEDLGRINFGQSIVSYFLLIASLGIATFATRNGSQIREDREKLEKFASEVFSINLFAMFFSVGALGILLTLPTKVADYKYIILIQGITVVLSPLAVEWLYNIEEDFAYITIRSICVQIVSLIMMFSFVKDSSDVYIYVAITSLSSCTANIFNFVHSRKYLKIKVIRDNGWNEYKKSITPFFINSLASVIYLSSDVTLLGILSTDYATGLYGAATKIYSIIKQMFNVVVGTMLPRMAYYKKNDEKSYYELVQKTLNFVFVFILPAMVGIVFLRKEIIIIISKEEYLQATTTLVILVMALFFATIANIFVSGVMICSGKERKVAMATSFSAVENILLNLIFIPLWNQNGAAFTTLLAEMTICLLAVYNSREILNKVWELQELIKSVLGCAMMGLVLYVVKKYICELYVGLRVIIIAGTGVVVFLLALLMLRSKIIIETIELIKRKMKQQAN